MSGLKKTGKWSSDEYEYDGLIREWYVYGRPIGRRGKRFTVSARVAAKYASSARGAVNEFIGALGIRRLCDVTAEPGPVIDAHNLSDPRPGRVELPEIIRFVGKPIVTVPCRSKRTVI